MRNFGLLFIEILIICPILGILAAIVVPPQFSGASRNVHQDDKQLIEMKVLVPSDCSCIQEVRYITPDGRTRWFKVEVEGESTPDMSAVD